ncbi:hypothetical protein [Serratia marcescens]
MYQLVMLLIKHMNMMMCWMAMAMTAPLACSNWMVISLLTRQFTTDILLETAGCVNLTLVCWLLVGVKLGWLMTLEWPIGG